jgi:hypothetical protein
MMHEGGDERHIVLNAVDIEVVERVRLRVDGGDARQLKLSRSLAKATTRDRLPPDS